jgi:hypothetical protein
VRAADGNLEERLRAAGSALREASTAQVDAATGLREIRYGVRAVADDQALPATGHSQGLAATEAPPAGPPSRRLVRASQRLALVVNLLLVVALSVALVMVAGHRQEPVNTAPVATGSTVEPRATTPASTFQTRVPEECLDAAELADEVIARLNRNQRDARLALALQDYSVASQACRREAAR